MELVLSVSRHPDGVSLSQNRYVFDLLGGVIGRSAECDWVLDDPRRILSSRHALIGTENRTFFIEDTSTNGVYINDAPQALGKGKRHALKAGDTLRMGEYILDVLQAGQEAEPGTADEPEPVMMQEERVMDAPTDFVASPSAVHSPPVTSVGTSAAGEPMKDAFSVKAAVQPVRQDVRDSGQDLWSVFVRELGVEDYLHLNPGEDSARELARVYRSALRVLLALSGEESAFYRRHHLTSPYEERREVNPVRVAVNERQLLQQLIFDRQPECMDVDGTMSDLREGLSRHMLALEQVVESLCPRRALGPREGSARRAQQKRLWLEGIMRARYRTDSAPSSAKE
ncbi:MAG: FHA domain-containing protein [Gammaproteobacteria bacterium]|nr:MAG: FHA domain-containing protein [Gammaproteobacteria bacterium]